MPMEDVVYCGRAIRRELFKFAVEQRSLASSASVSFVPQLLSRQRAFRDSEHSAHSGAPVGGSIILTRNMSAG